MLAGAGADVVLTYRSRRDEARGVVDTIQGGGRVAEALQVDLGLNEATEKTVERAAEILGGLDLVVVNAGIWPPEDVAVKDMSNERWRGTMAVNLDSVFVICRTALSRLGDGGRIVLIGSTAGQRGEANHADYSATKGAMIAFTKSLAVEAAPEVTVNCVAPGWIDTEMSKQSYEGGGRRMIESEIPLGRVATAKDVAGPVLFLCSHLARHITGEIVNVNGGSVLCG